MGGEGGRGGVLQEGDVVVLELRVLSVVEHRHHAKPEIKIRLWKPPCRCLEARNFDDCASKQIYVHIPRDLPDFEKASFLNNIIKHAQKLSAFVHGMRDCCILSSVANRSTF